MSWVPTVQHQNKFLIFLYQLASHWFVKFAWSRPILQSVQLLAKHSATDNGAYLFPPSFPGWWGREGARQIECFFCAVTSLKPAKLHMERGCRLNSQKIQFKNIISRHLSVWKSQQTGKHGPDGRKVSCKSFETPCPTRSLQSKLMSIQHFPRGMPVAVDHHMLRASQNCGCVFPISETESWRQQQQALPVPQAHG